MKTWNLGHIGVGILALGLAAAGRAQEGQALREIKKAVTGAKVSVVQAIDVAQKEVPKGKPVEVELEWAKSPACYEVLLLVEDKPKQVTVDAASAKVLGVEDQHPDAEEAEELDDATTALAAAKITVLQAIDSGEKEVKGGKTIGVGLEMEGGKPIYEVSLLRGDKVMNAEVDAISGKVGNVEEEPLPLAYWIFDQDEPGKAPAGLLARQTHPSDKPGTWQVAADATAPSKPNVLTLAAGAPTATFNVALFERTAYKDLDLRVRIRANSGKEDQGGGLIWRCKNENNYYICRINPLENNFRLYKVVDGTRTQLNSTEFKAQPGKWYRLRAVMVGDQITCYVNDKPYLEAKDDTFKDPGMIGLWTKADASSSFDNLAVLSPVAEKLAAKDAAKIEEKAKQESKKEGSDKDADD